MVSMLTRADVWLSQQRRLARVYRLRTLLNVGDFQMLKLTFAATALIIVGSLLVPPQATAAGRSPSPVPAYPFPIPFPGKHPAPRLFPVDPCKGVEQCISAPIRTPTPEPPIALPRSQPRDPCKGVEMCISAPIRLF